MSTNFEINNYCKNKKGYMGCFSIDDIHKLKLKNKYWCIINFQKSNEKGSPSFK